jgi:alpha-tubulin suppressor-like RCC1 family protein
LGNGKTTNSSTPVAVGGVSGAIALAAGGSHTCALLNNLTVRCWGANGSGQLGNGTRTDSSSGVVVTGLTNVVAVAAGSTHTCALIFGGSVKCWGDNRSFQLGTSTVTRATTPIAVAGLAGVTGITAGASHSCALLKGGSAKCWGSNGNGRLGDGEFANAQIATPTTVVNLTNATGIAGGGTFSCALLANSSVSCWGNGYLGQNGFWYGVPIPQPVGVNTGNPSGPSPGFSSVSAIAAGGAHSCALMSDASVKCWGDNFYGQLGNGTTTNTARPVTVSGLNGDITPPVTTIILPSNGATLTGNMTLDATASDNVGVTSVEFHAIDAAMHDTFLGFATRTIYGWILTIDSTGLPNGSYTLISAAPDPAGNRATSSPVSVVVEN